MLTVSMMIDVYSPVLPVNISRPCPLGSLFELTLVSEMTFYVSSGTLNPTHSLTHSELTAGSSSSSVSVGEVA